METEFKLKMGGFEGPLELLLDLVEKRKLHISDFSLSQVADEFIEHTKSYERFPIADSADFILIASTLLLIKSKSLLPNLELTQEEKGNIKDLEKRLILYQKFKEAAALIQAIFAKSPLYFPQESKHRQIVFSPTEEIKQNNLLAAIREIIKNAPKQEHLAQVTVQKVISLEEMIDSLSERVQRSIRTTFRDFSQGHKNDKVLVIVSFLAMLELVKQGVVRVSQERHFADIDIESETLGVPRY